LVEALQLGVFSDVGVTACAVDGMLMRSTADTLMSANELIALNISSPCVNNNETFLITSKLVLWNLITFDE
jgi:hypothetical protein